MTPDQQLIEAAKSNYLGLDHYIIANHHVDVNVQDEHGIFPTSVHKLPSKLCFKMLQTFFDPKQYPGRTPLHWATYYGNTKLVQLLLSAGCDVTLRCKEGYTALDIAMHTGEPRIAELLEKYLTLQKEAQENPTRETLRKAIEDNYPNIIKLLLKNCIAVDKVDLELAKKLNHLEIGRILIIYLGATTDQCGICKNGIVSTGITPDIARIIMSNIF